MGGRGVRFQVSPVNLLNVTAMFNRSNRVQSYMTDSAVRLPGLESQLSLVSYITMSKSHSLLSLSFLTCKTGIITVHTPHLIVRKD